MAAAFVLAPTSPTELVLALLAVPDSGVYRCTCFGCREECLDEDEDGVGFTFGQAVGDVSVSSCADAGGETREEAAGCFVFECSKETSMPSAAFCDAGEMFDIVWVFSAKFPS